MHPVRVLRGDKRVLDVLSSTPTVFTVVIGSTRTSTIPGISIAGPSPEATLYTPTLDVEYLVAGRPLTLDAIPVTPEGIPTPALLTRAARSIISDVQVLVVDAGAHVPPRVPHVALPSRREGGRIDTGRALPPGTAKHLYEEARLLGRWLGRGHVVVAGESIPGGTTTAMAILEALGIRARGRVSSAGPVNPHELKARIVAKALEAAGLMGVEADPFTAVDRVGDPVHISLAGLATGALEAGSPLVVLAGGTQMTAVLAILSRLSVDPGGRLAVITTRWIVEDRQSDFTGLASEAMPGATIAYVDVDFSNAPYEGLRAYERGYV